VAVCRYFWTVVNNHDVMDLPSHGRGRWFEPSIAHSQKVLFCRQNEPANGKHSSTHGTCVQQPS
jgi:hypothetical protein